MISQVNAACICHMQVQIVKIEALVLDGLPELTLVGGADSGVKESAVRVINALKNAGIKLPPKRITLNFYPAEEKKTGSHMDLAIAAAILAAYAVIDRQALQNSIFIGEVGLNGAVLPVRGVLPILTRTKALQVRQCYIPLQNAEEAALAGEIRVYAVSALRELIDGLQGKQAPFRPAGQPPAAASEKDMEDFKDVSGQPAVKRAVKIAAAGMHSFLMIGASGTGKTMTARRLQRILPPLTRQEQMELTALYSLVGSCSIDKMPVTERPMRSYSAGTGLKRLTGDLKKQFPGEMVLADRGVLFLDELSAFPANTLEIIRQASDEGRVRFDDGGRIFSLPAGFMLVSCMNACKCGAYPDMGKCTCSIAEIRRHAARISQSFLERTDICIHFPRISYEALATSEKAQRETTQMMQDEVRRAFEIQRQRYRDVPITSNRDLTPDMIKTYCRLDPAQEKLLQETYEKLHLSARTMHSVLKVARTIADLEQSEKIGTAHLIEAIGLRNIDRNFWKV